MKAGRRLMLGLLLALNGVTGNGWTQSTSASVNLRGSPEQYVSHGTFPAGNWADSVLDTGDQAVGRCRARALTKGLVGVETFMKTDANRGMDVFSVASASVSDQFLLELQRPAAYAAADSTVIRFRLRGALLVSPPIGWAELRFTLDYTRGGSSDFEYGLLVLDGNMSSAQWLAYNDTASYPGKTNLFLHPLNRSRYPIGQPAAFDRLYTLDRLFYAVIPRMTSTQFKQGNLGFSLFGVVAASGGRVAFHDTMAVNRANPVSFYVSTSGQELPLQPGDRFRSGAGVLTPEEWSNPVVIEPRLTIRHDAGQVTVSWPEALEQPFRLQRADRVGAPVEWSDVAATPVVEGTNQRVVLPGTDAQGLYRLRSAE